MKKTLTALLAAVVILGGLYFLLSSGVFDKKSENKEENKTESVIFSYDRPTVFMEIKGKETLTLDKKGDEWICREFPLYPMNNEELSKMGGFLSTLTAKRMLEGQNEAFGLSNPSLTVTFRLSDGTEHTLLLGVKNAATGDYYACMPGDINCFTVDGESADEFFKTAFEHVLIYELPQIPSDGVSSVRVNGKTKKNNNDIVSAVNSLYFSYCENAYASDLAKYGLSPAKYEIEVIYTEQGASRTFILYLGEKADNGYTYAAVSDLPNTVYCCFEMGIERLLSAIEG